MLTINEARKILKKEGEKLSNEDLQKVIDLLSDFAEHHSKLLLKPTKKSKEEKQ